LEDLRSVHRVIGGHGPGRRYATSQINNAYAVLLSSQFQKYCRDLHSNAADHIARIAPHSIQWIILARLTEGRKLDAGNSNPGNLGSDFNRLGFSFWKEVKAANLKNADRMNKLETLNKWRNAIAHHDFSDAICLGRVAVRLEEVAAWRRACNGLAAQFDEVVSRHLKNLTGKSPW
jgi:hypothetical protein